MFNLKFVIMKVILLLFPFFLFSCSLKEKKETPITILENSFNQENYDDKEVTLNNDETTSQEIVYIYENDTLKQTVKLTFINEEKIDFLFVSENKIKKQKESIQGIAKNNDGDIEIDEDDEGNAYPVNEYIYSGNCWLAIRINMEDESTIRIKVADCKRHNPNCPFYSVGLLLRQ